MATTSAQIADRLSNSGPWHVPDHVVLRLHTLLASEDLEYLTHDIGSEPEPDMDRGLYGVIVAFTSTRVIRLLLTAARGRPTSYERASVDADTWSRKCLESLSLPAMLEDRAMNSDVAWDDPINTAFPFRAFIQLRYAGDRVVTVPASAEAHKQDRTALLELLPSLCSDLAKV